MANIIAEGTTAANSADIVITGPVMFSISQSAGLDPFDCKANIQLKQGARYLTLAVLDGTPMGRAQVVIAPGTYRISKRKSTVAFGVEQG